MPRLDLVSLIQVEYRRRVATHHLLLILTRQGTDEFVQGGLRFQPDGPEVREVEPQSTSLAPTQEWCRKPPYGQ